MYVMNSFDQSEPLLQVETKPIGRSRRNKWCPRWSQRDNIINVL